MSDFCGDDVVAVRALDQTRALHQIHHRDGDRLWLGHYHCLSLSGTEGRRYANWGSDGTRRAKMTRVLFSPAQLVHFVCYSEQSEEIALILCVIGWIMIPVFCEGDVAAVGARGGFRIGKGSGGIVTTEKRKKNT